MLVTPVNKQGYNLLHEGVLCFSDIQQNGIRIDVEHCKHQFKKLGKDVNEQSKKLMSYKEIQTWKKIYGKKFNINSDDQLADVLYKKLKYTPQKTTESGNPSVDQEALQALGIPMVDDYLRYRKLDKIRNTFLRNLLREQHDGWLHPFLNLNTTKTYRSCVAKGTKILTPKNFKKHPQGTPIEKIKAGDFVYCFDDNLQPALKKVLWSGKTGHKEVIRVHWKSRGRSGYIEVTPEHLVRKTNGEYEEAQNLLSYDLRSENDGKRAAKHRVLACSRHSDRLYFTHHIGKHGTGILEHRFVYKNLINSDLKDDEIVHHKDGNHFNHEPNNLKKETPASHSSYHALNASEEVKKKRTKVLHRNRHKIKHKKGEDHPEYLGLSKLDCLKLIAKAGGKPSKVNYHCFNTFIKYAEKYGINWREIKLRYDKNGHFITKRRLRELYENHSLNYTKKVLGKNHYNIKELLDTHNIDDGNHVITKIEWTGKKKDVYDLEVEDCHNFIANEICVHNSSDRINIQNQPTRDPEAGEIIRRAFIARPGHCLLAGDYGGIEVKGSAWYHEDPTMLSYLHDPENSDMHADFCMLLFCLDHLDEEILGEKTLRKGTKNGFTFPQFYGDYYGNNAVSLFGWADLKTDGKGRIKSDSGMKIRGDKPLGQHLREHGIKTFEQFMAHIGKIEDDMWRRRFKKYKQWRDNQYNWYLKHGYVSILSGFICKGIMTRNATINYPIQGVCFHALLWSLIQLNKLIKKNNMRTKLIFQVHDEAVADVPCDGEYNEFLDMMKQVMVHDIKDHFTFINCPLELEAEASAVDGNWFEMSKVLQYIR